jgi:hypothetical protein
LAIYASLKRDAKVARVYAQALANPEPVKALGLTAEQLKQLQSQLEGIALVPGMNGWQAAAAGNPVYPAAPQLIIECAVFNDVRVALHWARRLGWPVTCRSGGHSTAGYSLNNGIVIDLGRLSYAAVDPVRLTVRAGAGTAFTHLNSTLATFGLHVPTGACGDVAVGGFMQGGGYGFTSREFGINCDCVEEVIMMLHDGRLVTANAQRNADLWWAVRGGTGNQFGVLLEVTYRLVPLQLLWGYALSWKLPDAAAAMQAVQEGYMKSGAPPQLGYMAVLATPGPAPASGTLRSDPHFLMMGTFNGSRDDGLAALAPLRDVGAPDLIIDRLGSYNTLNSWLLDSVLAGPPPTTSPDDNIYEIKGVQYIDRPLARADWERVVEYFADTPNAYNIACIEPYGGYINSVPALDTAFVHRDIYMDFFVDSFWVNDADRDAAYVWRDRFNEIVGPFANGQRYQNYPDRDLPDYRWQYWGDAFPSLMFVKQKYDPDNFFAFEQSITPYPDGANITRSTAASRFNDSRIEHEQPHGDPVRGPDTR